jgi:hypothetical protein
VIANLPIAEDVVCHTETNEHAVAGRPAGVASRRLRWSFSVCDLKQAAVFVVCHTETNEHAVAGRPAGVATRRLMVCSLRKR